MPWSKGSGDARRLVLLQLKLDTALAKGGKRAQAAREGELRRKDQKVVELEARVTKKDSVIAEISEIHLELKKHSFATQVVRYAHHAPELTPGNFDRFSEGGRATGVTEV